jgi:hypothetical protein
MYILARVQSKFHNILTCSLSSLWLVQLISQIDFLYIYIPPHSRCQFIADINQFMFILHYPSCGKFLLSNWVLKICTLQTHIIWQHLITNWMVHYVLCISLNTLCCNVFYIRHTNINESYHVIAFHTFRNVLAATCSHGFLVHRFFYPEDGGNTFLYNIGSHKIYMAPHPRRRHSWLHLLRASCQVGAVRIQTDSFLFN